ncbi:MAG TPA: hypothetical protein VK421_12030 [Pyrinomonadaceae bacterium]|nr:hypothetical protein [Pyrinomonadaceae bacterium]
MTARPFFLKLAAFFFAYAAAVALVAVFPKLLPDRPERLYAPPRPFRLSQDLHTEVGLVTLDRESGRSYTRLNLRVGRPSRAPEKLWVRTFFFSPDDPAGRVWGGDAIEIDRPFDEYGGAGVTVAAPCVWCDDEDAPRGGYFARVQVSDGYEETPLPYGSRFRDIWTAAPVVVHAERVPPSRR